MQQEQQVSELKIKILILKKEYEKKLKIFRGMKGYEEVRVILRVVIKDLEELLQK